MLYLTVPKGEKWIESEQRFIETDRDYKLVLEHSLLSMFKWEEKFKKPFLSTEVRTIEETQFYIKCMTINQSIPDIVYQIMPDEMIEEINEYITDSKTATVIKEQRREGQSGGLKIGGPTVTSEHIYSLMISYNIPVEFDRWHFSRLKALIELLHKQQEDSDPTKKKRKLTSAEIMARNNALNAKRRAKLKTRG